MGFDCRVTTKTWLQTSSIKRLIPIVYEHIRRCSQGPSNLLQAFVDPFNMKSTINKKFYFFKLNFLQKAKKLHYHMCTPTSNKKGQYRFIERRRIKPKFSPKI